MAAKLRAVAPDERRVEEKLTITDAAARGSVRQQLVALRDRVAKTVEDPNCPPRDLAALSRRMMELTKEIESIDERTREDGDDESATPDESFDAAAI